MTEATNDPGRTVAVVMFSVGPYRFGVEACQIAGMADCGAGDLPPNIETLMGLPAWPHDQKRIIRVHAGGGYHSVLVGGPVDLVSLPIDSVYPLPDFVAARLAIKGGRAIAWVEGKAAVLVDLSSGFAAHSVGAPQSGEQPGPGDGDQQGADAAIDDGGHSAEPGGSHT